LPTAESNAKVIIRTGQLDDAKQLLNIQREIVAENKYMISLPEEFDKTLDQQRNLIKGVLENQRETIIVAEVNKAVVGWLEFQSPGPKRMSHTGSLAMMIQAEYRGAGIGKMLLEKLLKWAKMNVLIEKVSLGVFSTNKRAISLYKKMGFKEEGRKTKEIKLDDNEYVDDILMYKWV